MIEVRQPVVVALPAKLARTSSSKFPNPPPAEPVHSIGRKSSRRPSTRSRWRRNRSRPLFGNPILWYESMTASSRPPPREWTGEPKADLEPRCQAVPERDTERLVLGVDEEHAILRILPGDVLTPAEVVPPVEVQPQPCLARKEQVRAGQRQGQPRLSEHPLLAPLDRTAPRRPQGRGSRIEGLLSRCAVRAWAQSDQKRDRESARGHNRRS